MKNIIIEIDKSVKSKDWLRLATKKAKEECISQGVVWVDAHILVKLPEKGRCFTKQSGCTAFVSIGLML